MSLQIVPGSLWSLRLHTTKLYTNASLAAGTDRILMTPLLNRNLYLCGMDLRPLTACKIQIKVAAGTPILEFDLAINEDLHWECGFFPLRNQNTNNGFLLSHDQGVAVTIVSTAWGLIGD